MAASRSSCLSTMFDWTSRDGVNRAPWGLLEEEGDRTVPYPTAGEIGGAGGLGGNCPFKDREIPESFIDVRSGGGQGIYARQDVLLASSFSSPTMESGSGFCTRGFVNLFGLGVASKSSGGHGMLTEIGRSGYVIDRSEPAGFDDSCSLSIDEKVEFDNNSGLSGNGYTECGDIFLDCDWSMANFDDPDGIFSDSMFWDGHISKLDGILSQANSLKATSRPLPNPDTVNSGTTGENLPPEGNSLGKRKHFDDDKMAINSVTLVEQNSPLSHFNSRKNWGVDIVTDKVGRRNKSLKSGKVDDSSSETKNIFFASSDINRQIQQTECLASVSQMFPSGSHHPDRLVGESCNSFIQCELAEDPHLIVPSASLSPFTAVGNVDKLFPTFVGDHPVPLKHSFLGNNTGVASGAVHLNPQEKIEKLKWRQQMQAMLAIEMQQKQLNDSMTHRSDQNKSCSGEIMRMGLIKPILVEHANLPNVVIEPSVTETIFCQLGKIISKLDDKLKMCMRDSLLRLARSASERMGIEDGSSTITCSNYNDKVASRTMDASCFRQFKVPETEPDTNRVDRIVAFLLFNNHQQTSDGSH